MFKVLSQALASGLSLWDHKEKHKYVDKQMKLEREFDEEDNKPPAERDNARLDDLRFELCVLSLAFSAAVKGPSV